MPKPAESLENLLAQGKAFFEKKRYAEALAVFERATELDPNLASAWNGKGAALTALGRLKEALAAFDRALALDPNDVKALNNRAGSLTILGALGVPGVTTRRSLPWIR